MIKKVTLFTFIIVSFLASANAQSKNDFYNVKNYGVKADGKTLDGKAINRAITVAAKAGGGTVYFPAGNYFTGTIHLQSNIALYIDHGATIIAALVNASNVYAPSAEFQTMMLMISRLAISKCILKVAAINVNQIQFLRMKKIIPSQVCLGQILPMECLFVMQKISNYLMLNFIF